MKLAHRLFMVVFSIYLGLTLVVNSAIYLITSSININQAKNYLATIVQYNAESIDKSLLRIFELLIYPSYLPSLYEKTLATDPATMSEAQKIILRRDIENIFAMNTYVPLRTYFPTSNYIYAISDESPVTILFSGSGPSWAQIVAYNMVSRQEYLPSGNDINVFVDYEKELIVFSKNVFVNDGGRRVFAGCVIILVAKQDLILAQDSNPVSSENMFLLKTPGEDLIRLSPGTETFPEEHFAQIKYANNRAVAENIRHEGKKYLMQPIKLNSGWELICLAPYSSINKSLSSMLVLMVTANFITILLLLYFAKSYIPKLISDPISKLSHDIGEVMNRDDYSRQLPVENSFSELTVLYNAYNRLMNHITRLIDKIYTENERARQAEILALQAQINPHYLYNTLDSIGWSMDKNNEEASSVLSSLATILRYSISDPNRLVKISDEIDIVREYINIQEFCYGLNIDLEVAGSMLDGFYLPKLTIQPLVENSIIHGIREASNIKPRIIINASMDENYLYMSVENNGKSPDITELNSIIGDEASITKHGLANVNRRLVIHFGELSRLSFSVPADGGLTVSFKIPV